MTEVEKELLDINEGSEVQEYLQMGQVLIVSQKYKEAVRMFEKTLKDEPMDKIAHIYPKESPMLIWKNMKRRKNALNAAL